MKDTYVKRLPNILSLSRIGFSISLLAFANNTALFMVIYAICAATDIVDGYIARKYKCETALGARLDSLGDFVFFMVILAYFAINRYMIIERFFVPIAAIAIMRFSSLAICRIRNAKAYSLHTVANKTTGIAIVAGIPIFVVTNESFVIAVLLIMAMLSALEELLIMITRRKPNINTRSIFTKRESESMKTV